MLFETLLATFTTRVVSVVGALSESCRKPVTPSTDAKTFENGSDDWIRTTV
jgi:hypothetical protein